MIHNLTDSCRLHRLHSQIVQSDTKPSYRLMQNLLMAINSAKSMPKLSTRFPLWWCGQGLNTSYLGPLIRSCKVVMCTTILAMAWMKSIPRKPPDTALVSYSIAALRSALRRFGCAFAALCGALGALQRFGSAFSCSASHRFTAIWALCSARAALWQRFAQRFQRAKAVFWGLSMY